MSHELIKIREAAELLGVTATTLRNWDKSGKLVPVRHPMSGYRMYKLADLVAVRNKLLNMIKSD